MSSPGLASLQRKVGELRGRMRADKDHLDSNSKSNKATTPGPKTGESKASSVLAMLASPVKNSPIRAQDGSTSTPASVRVSQNSSLSSSVAVDVDEAHRFDSSTQQASRPLAESNVYLSPTPLGRASSIKPYSTTTIMLTQERRQHMALLVSCADL